MAAFSGVMAINYGWSSFTAARELDTSGITTQQMGAYGSDKHYEFMLNCPGRRPAAGLTAVSASRSNSSATARMCASRSGEQLADAGREPRAGAGDDRERVVERGAERRRAAGRRG